MLHIDCWLVCTCITWDICHITEVKPAFFGRTWHLQRYSSISQCTSKCKANQSYIIVWVMVADSIFSLVHFALHWCLTSNDQSVVNCDWSMIQRLQIDEKRKPACSWCNNLFQLTTYSTFISRYYWRLLCFFSCKCQNKLHYNKRRYTHFTTHRQKVQPTADISHQEGLSIQTVWCFIITIKNAKL